MSFLEKIKDTEGKNFAKQMIKEYMKKNKLNLDEFLKLNPDYSSFEKNTRGRKIDYANIIKNHGILLDDNIYQEIIDEIKEEEIKKKELNVDIDTTVVNGIELSTVTDKKTGEQKIFDNTTSNRTIDNQMKTIQNEHNQFQNIKENNTLNIMNYMEKNIKITPTTDNTESLNINTLNNEEKEILYSAKNLENIIGHPIKIDLNQKLAFDKNNIYSLQKKDGIYNFSLIQKSNNEKTKVHTLTNTQTMNRKRDNYE